MIDFDEIDEWAPQLDAVLKACLSAAARRTLSDASPRYIEDARALLLKLTDRDSVIDATLSERAGGMRRNEREPEPAVARMRI